MIGSMTGFASVEQPFGNGRIAWELRTVNHRFLEIHLRLPEELRVLEPQVRECLAQRLQRGKVDCSLRVVNPGSEGAGRVSLNEPLARGLLAAHAELARLAGLEQEPALTRLLAWPGLVIEELADPAPMHEAVLASLQKATRALEESRLREGKQIAQALRERLDGIDGWTRQIREWLPEIRLALRARMGEKIAQLVQNLDPERLEQELAILAQKMDIDEELDRLDAHVAEARRALDLKEPVGRRLDFLMQEFNRESNTLSSKSVDQRTSQAAVELKVLIEQMREQVQNVE